MYKTYRKPPKEITQPADTDTPCDCCGRYHRKIKLVDGLWMGKTCEEQYKLYLVNRDITSYFWKGYEKQFKKIERMMGKRSK